jgi:hypothetical protein
MQEFPVPQLVFPPDAMLALLAQMLAAPVSPFSAVFPEAI